jgi:hypothetical protein
MIEAIKQDKYDILVVDHRDRFGVRDQLDFGRWASILRDHDTELWSVAGGHLMGSDLGSQVLHTVESGKFSAVTLLRAMSPSNRTSSDIFSNLPARKSSTVAG